MAFQWRQDMPANLVELAVGKCLIAEMDESRWTELGLVTGTKDRIYEHPRLLRSLRFGDDDYDGHVYDMVPLLLGDDELRWGAPPPPQDIQVRFPRLGLVADFLDLPAWLAVNEPASSRGCFSSTTWRRRSRTDRAVRGGVGSGEAWSGRDATTD